MRWSRSRLLLALVLAIGLALTFVWLREWKSTVGNPRVGHHRLSDWFAQAVKGPWSYVDDRWPRLDLESETVLEAFRSLGTNALPFLFSELLPPNAASPTARWRHFVREFLPARWVSSVDGDRWRRRDTARGLLVRLGIPGPELVAWLEPRLASTNYYLRNEAIECLGTAGVPRDRAIERLRAFLDPRDPGAAKAAMVAASHLGASATHLVDELAALAGGPLQSELLLAALGNCGPSASNAVPALQALWEKTTARRERMPVAVALCRIQPGHPEAMAFLESVARGDEAGGGGDRVRPGHLAGALGQVRAHGEVFMGLLRDVLLQNPDLGRSGEEDAMRALNRIAPAEAQAILVRAIRGAVGPEDRIRDAGRLLQLQPSNAVAIQVLVDEARGQGFSAAIAALRLRSAEPTPEPAKEVWRRLSTNSSEGINLGLRRLFREALAEAEARERLAADTGLPLDGELRNH